MAVQKKPRNTLKDDIARNLAAAEAELEQKKSLNGTKREALFFWRQAGKEGVDLAAFPLVDAYFKNEKQARQSPPKQKPAPEPIPEEHADAKAIGHPLKLPDHIQNTDHPTVWFLAQREAITPEGGTF